MLTQPMDLAATIVDYNMYIRPKSQHSFPIWTAVAMISEITVELLSGEPKE
jgi:hypothetical protein